MITSIANCVELADILNRRMHSKEGGNNQRLAIMLGMLSKRQTIEANLPSGDRSNFAQTKYMFFLDAPFEISNKCCNVMKKNPVHLFQRQTGRKPMLAVMAEESRLRTQKWIQNGCNGFEMKSPVSNPMAFWREQDVLRYIKENNIPIASVYGDIVTEYGDECEGQMDISDLGLAEDNRILKTTGCSRTGCMYCAYGCHLEEAGEGRFERMKITHPKQYEYIMKPREKGGLGFKEVIDWINENGNLNIRY